MTGNLLVRSPLSHPSHSILWRTRIWCCSREIEWPSDVQCWTWGVERSSKVLQAIMKCVTCTWSMLYRGIIQICYREILFAPTLVHHHHGQAWLLITFLKQEPAHCNAFHKMNNTVVLIRVQYFVLLNYSYKSWSIMKTDLESAGPDIFKKNPTCPIWPSFGWDIWG